MRNLKRQQLAAVHCASPIAELDTRSQRVAETIATARAVLAEECGNKVVGRDDLAEAIFRDSLFLELWDEVDAIVALVDAYLRIAPDHVVRECWVNTRGLAARWAERLQDIELEAEYGAGDSGRGAA